MHSNYEIILLLWTKILKCVCSGSYLCIPIHLFPTMHATFMYRELKFVVASAMPASEFQARERNASSFHFGHKYFSWRVYARVCCCIVQIAVLFAAAPHGIRILFCISCTSLGNVSLLCTVPFVVKCTVHNWVIKRNVKATYNGGVTNITSFNANHS